MTPFNLIHTHREYVHRARLIDKMLYELDQCGLKSEHLEKKYADLMDRARDIRRHLNAT